MAIELTDFISDPALLLNAVGEGIYGFDLEGKAIFINPAAERMTGWKSSDLIGKNIHQYHHHSHADGSEYPACDCKIYATMQDGISRHVTNEVFWRKDGTSFPVEYTSTAVFRDKKLIGAVAVFRDVSEQKRQQHALESALAQVKELSEQLAEQNTYLKKELNQEWHATGLVGNSQTFQRVLSQIELVAATDSTVLILGENGTGKELVARNLHQMSNRKDSPMVKVNCAAFTASLLESELFGHEKGAFTGATERRKGKFELADGGTLFLDEIGELSVEAQSKLLRVLQEQEFERVGGSKVIKVNIRVIAATNRDLKAMVDQGLFRMDLFYRLNVFPIEVPPLKDRIEDLPLLCQSIISRLNDKLGKAVDKINNKSLAMLKRYQWPGNVRELQNVLEREMILSTSRTLTLQSFSLKDVAELKLETLVDAEKQHILNMLEQTQWKIGGAFGAAKLLDLPPSTLRSKMQKLGIKRP
ncbi:sigma-54 interaction domain-containing protein [Thalassotalea marina]|uniref:Sigma-54-dependent Fis family transcriptional regulator n=1 Tax=Thalassotalea marina TaxID=1673741 RepID=A0A919BAZ9_9GAMM|nr:sigma 54-interacting transcriptional regulator [Thalassotalea marina]GHF78355.1 sigma-54-dependent Fis family transcriptional regulator [Thalassotalea marina]